MLRMLLKSWTKGVPAKFIDSTDVYWIRKMSARVAPANNSILPKQPGLKIAIDLTRCELN